LFREIPKRGYSGGYTQVKTTVRERAPCPMALRAEELAIGSIYPNSDWRKGIPRCSGTNMS